MERLRSSWLKSTRISDKVWRVEDAGMVSQYLISGDEKALLIDAGWGVGDLSAIVSGLTSLPLTVINTHGHPDHTCGNYRFDNVRIHREDVPMLKKNFSPKVRYELIKRFKDGPLPEGFSAEAWVHAPLRRFTPIQGPVSFDLGGRTIDVIETPGHTPGSICLYDRKDRLLFTSDNLIKGNIMLHFDESPPLSIFLDSVNKLAAMADRIVALWPAHGSAPMKPSTILDLQKGVKKVLEGKLRGAMTTTRLGTGMVIRFGSCGIMYRDDRRF
ncbi:MAG TPA: MBL fold metallo-hydrolase [Methanocella sp.]|nr:MBL fold metallo-hydrolase [Methanocella sp.]